MATKRVNADAIPHDSIQGIVGSVASGATDDGSEPVKVGGRNNTTPPALTDGQRGDLQIDTRGNLKVALFNTGGTSQPTANNSADAATGSSALAAGAMLFNGTTWDRQRDNVDTAALITAVAATGTQTGTDQTNYNGRGVIVVMDATAVTGVGSFTLSIQGKDAASGKYYTILAGAAVTTVTTNVYTVYPGAPATANVSANSPLPRVWRVLATYNSGTNLTFTVGASVIL